MDTKAIIDKFHMIPHEEGGYYAEIMKLAAEITTGRIDYALMDEEAKDYYLPLLQAQFVTMVKETSIVGYITALDLTLKR